VDHPAACSPCAECDVSINRSDTGRPDRQVSFAPLLARLDADAEEGLFHTAAQIVVVHAGERVCDAAVGTTHLHEPFRPDTLSALYCTAKPLVTLAVLRLVADDELSLDDRVGDVVEGIDAAWIADRTIEQLLGHTAGLHGLGSIVARVLPERSRWSWITSFPPPPGWRFGTDRAYAEFAGWYLLGRVVESLTGEAYDTYLERAVLEPYGVDRADLVVRFDPPRFAQHRGRISATLDLTGHRPIPLLAEVGVETACEWNPAFGAYGTMGALASFYEGIRNDLAGAGLVVPADLLRHAATPRLPERFDPTLDRDACFGLGFMAPMSAHRFGDAPSPEAFGHAGQGGTSFGFVDPPNQLVVAVLFNAGLDAETSLDYRRRHITDGVYRALGLV
jgi:CubicO group peptidase (beta-lactamase class C family)